MNICKLINLKGFTLMETLVGVMLIGIGSAALFLGLTQSIKIITSKLVRQLTQYLLTINHNTRKYFTASNSSVYFY